MRFVRSIATYVVIIAVTLGFVEIVLRIADFRDIRVIPEQYRLPYDHDPELGWYPIPGKPTGFGDLINSLGLRDVELVDDGRPTILFIGDSLTYGVGVKADERFSELLRQRMPQFRIVNAGVAAYGTDQEYLLLRRLWPRIKPSVVVLIFCEINDRDDNSTNSRHGHTLKPYLAQVNGQWRFQGLPVPRSYRWYFDHNVLAHNIALVRVALEVYAYLFHRAVTVPDPTNQLVLMMRDFVEQRGAKFLAGLQDRDAALESFLSAQKIPFALLDGGARIPDGDHWNPQGHAMVAERLKALFVAEKLLGPADAVPAMH